MASTNAIIHIYMYKRSSTLVYQIHNYYTSTHTLTHTILHAFRLPFHNMCAHRPSPYDLHLFFAITYHPYLNTIKSFTYFVHFDVPSLSLRSYLTVDGDGSGDAIVAAAAAAAVVSFKISCKFIINLNDVSKLFMCYLAQNTYATNSNLSGLIYICVL